VGADVGVLKSSMKVDQRSWRGSGFKVWGSGNERVHGSWFSVQDFGCGGERGGIKLSDQPPTGAAFEREETA